METNDIARGFTLFTKSITGRASRWKDSSDPAYIFTFPFPNEARPDRMLNWCGFGSDDYLDLLRHYFAGDGIFDPETMYVIFWKANYNPSKENGYPQNQIWLELGDRYDVYLCSGLTDYSGSGGAAYQDCKRVIEFLKTVFPYMSVETREVSMMEMDVAWRSVNEQLVTEQT